MFLKTLNILLYFLFHRLVNIFLKYESLVSTFYLDITQVIVECRRNFENEKSSM